MQRHAINLSTSLSVKRPFVSSIAKDLTCLSMGAINSVCHRLKEGRILIPADVADDEMKVVNLMRQVNIVNAKVQGTSSSKMRMRNEIRAMIVSLGIPTYFVTINPMDTHNPIVKFMYGDEFDLNNMCFGDVSDIWHQSSMVSKDPFTTSEFFNKYLKIFFKHVLGFDNNVDKQKLGALV